MTLLDVADRLDEIVELFDYKDRVDKLLELKKEARLNNAGMFYSYSFVQNMISRLTKCIKNKEWCSRREINDTFHRFSTTLRFIYNRVDD